MEVGGRGRVYTYRYTVTTRTTCIEMGSDESHFNVSLIVRDKVTRPCPQTTTLEEKRQPQRRYRTEVLPLTSLPALPLGQTGSPACDGVTLKGIPPPRPAPLLGSRQRFSADNSVDWALSVEQG